MIAQVAMFCAGACYLTAASAYVWDGKLWMAASMAMYACCCVTIYMAGTR